MVINGTLPRVNGAEAVGRTLAALGVRDAFGVLGSGNFVASQALHAAGAAFHHARHEGAAVSMADAYARVSGRVGVCTVHQGPGFTNALTGLTEAAKSRTPLLLVAGEAPASAPNSNFALDQAGVAETLGAFADRIYAGASAAEDTARAYRLAATERRPVLLSMPLDVQAEPAPDEIELPAPFIPPKLAPADVAEAQALLDAAERPLILAGRGAVLADAREPLEALAEAAGALLATSAMGHGLFAGNPWALGISGGFASPVAAELIAGADLILAFGVSLTRWTTRDGALIRAPVVQVDRDPLAFGRHRPVELAIHGDAAEVARELRADKPGVRTPELRERIEAGAWPRAAYEAAAEPGRIDPRTLTRLLDEALPADRTVAVDSGHFMGFPPMYLHVPDPAGFVFTQAFQSIGLGLASAIGASVARPDRVTVACVGDGGALMALGELETLARLRPNVIAVVYDDGGYGAEVHHFGPQGRPTELVRFGDTDFAALARAVGLPAITVRTPRDITDLPARGPMLIDAKVSRDYCAEWLEEAFK